MKKIIYLIIIISVFTLVSCKSENLARNNNNAINNSNFAQTSKQNEPLNTNQPSLDSTYNLSSNHLDVLQSNVGVLIKDSGKQRVELLGKYVTDSDYNHTLYTNLRITNIDTNEILVDRKLIDDSTGIPELFLADFTGEKLDEIMVVIHSGGIHDYEKEYQFYSLVNNNLITLSNEGILNDESLIFSFENDKGIFYSKKLNIKYEVNLPEELLEIYKNETEGEPNKSYVFEPVDIDKDGVSELKGDLYIFNSLGIKSTIARFEIIYKLKESNWELITLKLIESK